MLVHPQLFHCLFVEDQALLALVEAVMHRVWSYLTTVLAVACAQALQMPCKTIVRLVKFYVDYRFESGL